MKPTTREYFWLIVGLLVILAPLLLLLIGPRPAGREFWRELSVALGFAGMSLMGLGLIITARLPFLATVFPLDALYYFHHRISLVSLVLVLAHPALLFLNNRYTLRLLNVFIAPWRARAAVAAVILLALLIATSVWRKRINLDYDRWRIWHDALSIGAVGLGLYHMFAVNYHMAMLPQRVLWVVLGAAYAGAVAWMRVIKPLLMLKRPYRVAAIRPERGESWTVVLEPVGHKGMRFLPGQVAWLIVQRSPFQFRQHPFSFSSSAQQTDRIEFTIKALGDFTSTVKDIPIGEKAYVDGPYGTFDIEHHRAPGYVFLAGGIGIAPIMSILRTMADREDQRPLLLFYGNKTWEGITFREEIEQLQRRLNLKVVHVLEQPPAGWAGETGYLTLEVLDRHLPADRKERVYFVCGPLPMIKLVQNSLKKLGIPLSKVHSEQYEMA